MSNFLQAPTVLGKAKISYSAWFQALADFPKIYRYNLGGKIEGYFLAVLENIFISAYLPGERKAAQLSIAILKLDNLKFFLQLAWENKCLSTEKYTGISTSLDEIGRMLGGWKKGLENKTPAPRTREI